MPFSLIRFPSSVSSSSSSSSPAAARKKNEDWTLLSQKLRTKMTSPASLFHMTVFGALLISMLAFRAFGAAAACTSLDQPNPIASVYPNNATGLFNATLAILPIPLKAARQIVPAQWGILEGAYRELLPNFPKDMYPLFIQAGHDHDIQFASLGLSIPDFMRVGFEFPFIDLLGDGYSAFRWVPYQLIEGTNTAALEGSRAYGADAEPAAFDPPCDAYRSVVHHGSSSSGGATYFRGRSTNDSSVFAELEFYPAEGRNAADLVPVSFFKNVTNQPSFGNGSSCDQQIRLFGTAVSQGRFTPANVVGKVLSDLPPLRGRQGLGEVYGVQVATPFIENNFLDCQSLKGYHGVNLPGY